MESNEVLTHSNGNTINSLGEIQKSSEFLQVPKVKKHVSIAESESSDGDITFNDEGKIHC